MFDKHHKPDSQRAEECLRFGQSPAYRQDLFCDVGDYQGTAGDSLHDGLILPFDKTLTISSGLAELIASLCDYDGLQMQHRKKKPSAKARNQQKQALALLVLHCVSACEDLGDCPVAIAASANSFGNTGLRPISTVGYDAFISARDMLLISGALRILKNGNVNSYSGKGLASLYYASRDFLGWIIPALPVGWRDHVTRSLHTETVLLRSCDITKRTLNYSETPQSQLWRDNLTMINQVNSGVSLGLDSKALAAPDMFRRYRHINRSLMRFSQLRRIFNNGDWSQGGRLYGGWWQMVSKDLRSHILINGEATAEADFKALHPSLLYHRTGAAMPDDPYAPAFIGCPKVDRKHIKKAFNALINTSGGVKEPKDYDAATSGISWRDLLKHIEAAHTPIATAFRTGMGLFLQRTDSDIAEQVLLHFAKRGKPCLPIHDSFIVKQPDLGELVEVMKKAAMKVAEMRAVVEVKDEGGPLIRFNRTCNRCYSSMTDSL